MPVDYPTIESEISKMVVTNTTWSVLNDRNTGLTDNFTHSLDTSTVAVDNFIINLFNLEEHINFSGWVQVILSVVG